MCPFECEKKQLARKAKEEEERLKEMRNSSYIIYDEYEPDKFIGKNQSHIKVGSNTVLLIIQSINSNIFSSQPAGFG